jgi:hypothetical protein
MDYASLVLAEPSLAVPQTLAPILVAGSSAKELSDQCAQISVSRSLVFDRRGSGHEAAPLGQGN